VTVLRRLAVSLAIVAFAVISGNGVASAGGPAPAYYCPPGGCINN
jgi:hypothetical protein